MAVTNYLGRLRFDLSAGDLLLIDGFKHLRSAPYGRFNERLPFPELKKNLRFFEFLLVLLEGLVYVFAIFRIDDQHNIYLLELFKGWQR